MKTATPRPLMLIGVCTYQRPDALKRLLVSLTTLELPEDHDLALLIVENAAEVSVQPIVDAIPLPFGVDVIAEPARGLSNVRNRLLDEAEARQAAVLVGLDDDETVVPGWARAYEIGLEQLPHCAFLMGWVDYVYEGRKSGWITPEQLGRQIFGQERAILSTTNYALRRKVFDTKNGIGLRFSDRYNFSGGEDTDFFNRLKHRHNCASGTIPQALTIEHITPERSTLSHMLARKWGQLVIYYGWMMNDSGTASAIARYRSAWRVALLFLGGAAKQLIFIGYGYQPLLPRLKKNCGAFLGELVSFLAFFGALLGQRSNYYNKR